MADIRPLAHAPVLEALFDSRVELPPEITPETLKSLHAEIAGDYPEILERRRWRSKIEFTNSEQKPPSNEDLGVSGYLIKSADGARAVQFRLDGFTFSQLRPYSKWEESRDEAKRLWAIYKSVGVTRITRVATRFINTIDIPQPDAAGIESFIIGLPPVPAMDLALHSFMNRIFSTNEN